MNKYEQIPEDIIDLHGYTKTEAEAILGQLLKSSHRHVRVITGTGASRGGNPVLRDFVVAYLNARSIRLNPARREHGGDGALEVFLR